MDTSVKNKSWSNHFSSLLKPTNIAMMFLGFSAGLPILLIFSSLSLWLREAGVDKASVTYFSWAALGYSFKFIWAPIVDRFPLPLLKKMGRRKSWLLLSQVLIIFSICGMALTDPSQSSSALTVMAWFAVLLGFSSATQDIVIDAYRIESDHADMQGILSSTYIVGYRIGMIVAGAGALFLASFLGSTKESYSYSAWQWTYVIMASTMLLGVLTTLIIPEPKEAQLRKTKYLDKDYLNFFLLFLIMVATFVGVYVYSGVYVFSNSVLKSLLNSSKVMGFLMEVVHFVTSVLVVVIVTKLLLLTHIFNREMINETYVSPVKEFFQRYGRSIAILLLCLIGSYRLSDIVLGVISNVFYQDLGFSKQQIASIVKTFGLVMTLVGGFLGGLLTARFGVMRILFLGALLSAGTNLLFMVLAHLGNHLPMLYLVISVDNLSAGLASAAFIAFLSSLTNISFTAVQYAIFSSLMTLLPKVLGGYSGTMVKNMGYSNFFLFTAIIGLPVLILVKWAHHKLDIKEPTLKK